MKTIEQMAVEFGEDIRGPLRMNCNNFCDLLTFYLALSSGQVLGCPEAYFGFWPNSCKTIDVLIILYFVFSAN